MSKEKWEMKKLGDVGNIFTGNSINAKIKKQKYTGLNEGIPYIATKDVGFDNVLNYDNGVRIPYKEENSFKIAPSNTPIICIEGGSAGRKIGFTNQDVSFGNKLLAFVPKGNLLSRFVYYYYFTPTFQENFISELTGIIGGVSMSKFKSIEIPLPSLSEQQRIVSLLDEAFEAIDTAKANAEKNLKNAKELFNSYLEDIFENKGEDWEERKFKDVCVLQRGFDLPTRLREKGKYPLVSSNGITDYVNNYKVKSPGVVTGRSGTIGSVHYVKDDFWPLNTSLYIKEFYENNERFIYYFLKYFKLDRFKSGAGVPTLNRNNVHNENVIIPTSLSDQQTIVDKLDALRDEIQKLETLYQQKTEDLEELRKSTLEKAFSGEL